jgi:hypothetical protein
MAGAFLSRALTVALILALAACASSGPDASTPLDTASATSGASDPVTPTDGSPPTASPVPSPSGATGDGYAVGTTIQVVADAVRLRGAARIDADLLAVLPRDTRASVIGGPTDADGYTWYEIEGPGATGWVAAGDAEDHWIVAVPGIETAELAFRFTARCDVTPPLVAPAFTLTSDRQVVMTVPETGRWQTGRLTEAAYAELAAITIERPELARSATYGLERRPGAGEPPGHGLCAYEFTLGPPDERIRVTSIGWLGDEEESTYYLPAPERRALDDIARRLMGGAGFIPDSAWSDPPAEYRATTHLAWLWPDAGSPTAGSPRLEELSVLDGGEAFGEPIRSGRCGYLARADAEELQAAFAGSQTPLDLATVSYLTVASDAGWVNLVTSPMTPDGFPTCGDIPD